MGIVLSHTIVMTFSSLERAVIFQNIVLCLEAASPENLLETQIIGPYIGTIQ